MSAAKKSVEVRPVGSWHGVKLGESVKVDAETAKRLIEQGAARPAKDAK